MKVKKQVFRIITAAAVLFILALTLSVLLSAVCLHVQHYEIELRGLQSKVRLVLLSDLHCKSFGKDNARLCLQRLKRSRRMQFVLRVI